MINSFTDVMIIVGIMLFLGSVMACIISIIAVLGLAWLLEKIGWLK